MVPDQGCYEERYRLIGAMAVSLVVNLGLFGLALHGSHESVWLTLALLALATVTVPCLISVLSRRVAFRADPIGVTLGGHPLHFAGAPLFIPWGDVERIVVYQRTGSRKSSGPGDRLCVGIQRRPTAPPLPDGNGPAPGCPIPGVAEEATRQTVAWRLDLERLTALAAAVAPGVPVVDVRADPAAIEAGA